ncbi:aldehyde dehydrogenase family protein, partial [Escherichia coli]
MTNNPPSAQIKPGEYGFPLKLKARYDNFIGGEWVAPADGEYYQNLTPVTGQLLCEVASSGKRDIDLALDAAHKVKDKWAHTSVQDRAAILFKIADRMEQNLELLATAETWDNGKPIRETSAADVPLAIDHFRYFASCIRAQEGGISEVDSETVAYHFHEPLGVVGQIIPWNFPLLMASWKMAPALAAGNCVVLKPARLTPLSVLLLMEIVGDLLPPGVVNVVNGAGGEIGEYLATSKRIAKVAFTGSTEVGQQIMQYATQNIIPVTLELGGKSPNIFFADVMDEEDAFFDKALEGFALFAFNQGEVCTCPSRALVQESIYERFMERAIRRVESIRSGNPLDSVTQMGWIFSAGILGLLPGALVGGMLADRYGRKRILIGSVALFGLFSLATAIAWDFPSLVFARLMTGVGLGAALPNLIALTSEAAGPRFRGTAVSLMYCGVPIGAALAATLGFAGAFLSRGAGRVNCAITAQSTDAGK